MLAGGGGRLPVGPLRGVGGRAQGRSARRRVGAGPTVRELSKAEQEVGQPDGTGGQRPDEPSLSRTLARGVSTPAWSFEPFLVT